MLLFVQKWSHTFAKCAANWYLYSSTNLAEYQRNIEQVICYIDKLFLIDKNITEKKI